MGRLNGIITVLNTPLRADDSVDLPALKRNVECALKAGVCGFLVPAMASEVHKLTTTERLRIVDAVLEAAGDRVPVIAGTAHEDPARSRYLLKAHLDAGCTHVLFQIPVERPGGRRAEARFKRRFFEMAALNPEVIMLQDWDAAGYGLPDRLILELFERVEAFKCLKIETVPAGVKYSRLLELTNGQLHVSGGWAVSQMIEGLRRGVHAFMPTGMHYIYTQIYNDFTSGHEGRAQRLFEAILPVVSFSNQHLDLSIHFFKRLLHRQGMYPTDRVREPILPFDAVHEEIAGPLIGRVLRLEEQIGSEREAG